MISNSFLQATKDSIPTFFAYFFLGIIYGILFTTELSYPWFIAPIISLITYAGAVQFIVLGMIATQGSIIGIFITTVFVALRNAFYGLSMLTRFEKIPFCRRQYLIFGLVDATYSILLHRGERIHEAPYLFHLNWVIHFYWVSGTFIGAFFGNRAVQMPGLEFSLTALFTIFFIEQWKKSKDLAVVIVSLLGFAFGWLFFGDGALIFAMLLTFVYILVRYYFKERPSS